MSRSTKAGAAIPAHLRNCCPATPIDDSYDLRLSAWGLIAAHLLATHDFPQLVYPNLLPIMHRLRMSAGDLSKGGSRLLFSKEPVLQ